MYYKAPILAAALNQLVGYRSTTDTPKYPQSDVSNQTSESGLFINDVLEGVLGNETLYALMREKSDDPNMISEAQFNEELTRTRSYSITELLNSTLVTLGNKQIVQQTTVYNSNGRVNQVIKSGRFVGAAFDMRDSKSIVTALDGISLCVTDAQSIDLYIYHTSQPNKIMAQITVTVSADGVAQWTATTETLYNDSLEVNGEGIYIIGYYEDDLIGQALGTTQLKGFNSCTSCGATGNYKKFSNYVRVYGVVGTPAATRNEMPEMRNSNSTITFGLNFKFRVICDITSVLVSSKDIFAYPLQLHAAKKWLQRILTSTNVNGEVYRAAEKVDEVMRAQVDMMYEEAIKDLKRNLSGLDFPCQQNLKTNRSVRVFAG
jgi:hypothetical protein